MRGQENLVDVTNSYIPVSFCSILMATWSKIEPQYWLHFAKLNMQFIHLLTINFSSDVLVRFQKAIINDSNGRPSDSHHNLLFMKFWFWKVFRCFIMIEPLSQSFTIVLNDPFFITSHYAIKKWIIQVLSKQYWTHFKKLSSLIFTEFKWNPFIQFLHLASFLKMIQYCWNAYTHW